VDERHVPFFFQEKKNLKGKNFFKLEGPWDIGNIRAAAVIFKLPIKKV
jgi:hypothetical protein